MRTELAASFPSSNQSPAAARVFLRSVLDSWALHEVDDVVELLATELIANVVCHVGSPMIVRIIRHDETVRVEVDDDSSRLPVVRQPGPMDSSGRGILIVERMATKWGVERRGQGKTVWFEVDTSS